MIQYTSLDKAYKPFNKAFTSSDDFVFDFVVVVLVVVRKMVFVDIF